MEQDDFYSKAGELLIQKFNDLNSINLKKIDDEKIKLLYYNLFFDSYQEIFYNQFNFIDDINIYLHSDSNTIMVFIDQKNVKKIIFETPHYSIINSNHPSNNWKILKLR